jgi:hypothetical protein
LTTTEIIASIAIVSAFTSATLVTYFNYRFAVKTKKLDILYSNRLTAFKNVATKIVSFQNFCTGKLAYSQGNEYSPFYEEGFGGLHHRTEIANSLQTNAIFLSKDSLLNQTSGLCNGEAALAVNDNKGLNLDGEYSRMETLSESAVDVLYAELGIGKV